MTEIVRLKNLTLKGGRELEPTYVYFKGIPYAEPPIGALRFQVNIFDLLEVS